ncbi:protein Loquacious-like isoform X3 [Rhynchophorus ferrugineus]|uniref:protein Loquacious-like isoform X3 n=1 Tax=Rhynchophorus ferrugineus TaxID=354439 RepID=UPI003FCEBC90
MLLRKYIIFESPGIKYFGSPNRLRQLDRCDFICASVRRIYLKYYCLCGVLFASVCFLRQIFNIRPVKRFSQQPMEPVSHIMPQHQPMISVQLQPGHHHHRRAKNHKTITNMQTMSLTEEAKLVYNNDGNGAKTPVSVLQELLSRRGITPKYELLQIEGAIHEPVFRFRVFLNNDFVATGTGRSKKDAKHTAAKNLLDLLVGKQSPEQANQSNGTPGANDITAQVVSPFDDKVMGNPIGWLQEMCMSKRWPPPFYEMEHEEGLPHERQFTIACQVLKFREVGTGKSKKIAKRVAAHKMWQALQDMPLECNYLMMIESDEETVNLASKDFNFVQFLQEIASEQNFEVTYVDIEEKSLADRCQCLVQLSTLPVAVCFGNGKTPKDAQSNAAHNALEYLKIMTKK